MTMIKWHTIRSNDFINDFHQNIQLPVSVVLQNFKINVTGDKTKSLLSLLIADENIITSNHQHLIQLPY